MRSFLSAWINGTVLALATGCGSGPVETWEDALARAGHTETSSSYCDARAVIQDKCVRCHADPPRNGAPFPLDTYAATQQPSPSRNDPDRIRADRMLAAVESDFMPLVSLALEPPVEPLSCEERATLLAWLRDGSPGPADGDQSCRKSSPRLLECTEGD